MFSEYFEVDRTEEEEEAVTHFCSLSMTSRMKSLWQDVHEDQYFIHIHICCAVSRLYLCKNAAWKRITT